MRPTLLLTLLALGAPALAGAQAPDVDLPALLQRLAATEAARDARSDDRTVVETSLNEELDKKGRVESTTERVMRRTRLGGKTVKTELVRSAKDGKDTTAAQREKHAELQRKREEERKKEQASGKGKKSVTLSLDASPFAADQQPRYVFELRPARPADPPRHARIAFRPRGEPAVELLQGEALVDAEAAELVRVEATLSKLPKFADRVALVLEFGPGPSPGYDLTRTRMEGEGGFLFVRKRVRSVTSFAYAP